MFDLEVWGKKKLVNSSQKNEPVMLELELWETKT
jgi:hypothetical protein